MNKIERFNKIAAANDIPLVVLDFMQIKEGQNILEIGVGGGHYATLFAERVGKDGLYYGMDIDQEFLDNLILRNEQSAYHNIIPVKSTPEKIPSFDTTFDFIFSRNTYHHLKDRVNFMKSLNSLLRKKGKVVVIDYDESFSRYRLFGHYTRKSTLIKEMNDAGFTLYNDNNILKNQSFLIFQKK